MTKDDLDEEDTEYLEPGEEYIVPGLVDSYQVVQTIKGIIDASREAEHSITLVIHVNQKVHNITVEIQDYSGDIPIDNTVLN